MKQNNFLDALELALSFYNGTAMAVIGRSTFSNVLFNSSSLLFSIDGEELGPFYCPVCHSVSFFVFHYLDDFIS